MALVRLYVHNAASIESVADTAPPFDVFSADGTSNSVTTGPKPFPLIAPSVISLTLLAKNALFDAGFWADVSTVATSARTAVSTRSQLRLRSSIVRPP